MDQTLIKSLCNENRIKLLLCLSEKDKTVTELIQNCGLSQSAVSQHLAKLSTSGLVDFKKEGREVRYSIASAKITKICKLLSNLGSKDVK